MREGVGVRLLEKNHIMAFLMRKNKTIGGHLMRIKKDIKRDRKSKIFVKNTPMMDAIPPPTIQPTAPRLRS